MRNRHEWQPSKYVYRKGKLIASRDSKEVGIGSRLIADLVAKAYDNNVRHFARGKLLDLGCGKVPLFHVYKDYISDNICVDWGNTLHKSEHLDFERDLTRPLPFNDGEFNTIVLSDVLEHIFQPEKLWQEMSRVLSVGGRVLLNVPFFYWIHEQPHDYYRYTEFALRRSVEMAGLRLIRLESLGGAPEILADVATKSCLGVPFIGRSAAILGQRVAMFLVRTRFGRRASAKTKHLFPLAYFLVAEKIK